MGKFLNRNRVHGGTRLIAAARALGLLDVVVRYKIAPGVTFDVPVSRSDNAWDEHDLWHYESEFIRSMVKATRTMPEPVHLIDGGADIGFFSVMMAAQSPRIGKILAFEPNTRAYPTLATNIARLPVTGHALNAALGEFSGRGRLEAHPSDPSDHARYIVAAPDGDIPVVRIDDLGIGHGESLVLKLDVEGWELAAIRGALGTLKRVRACVVAFEGLPRVTARTGVDPIECIRLLQSVRAWSFHISELPGFDLRTDQRVFEQVRGPNSIMIVGIAQ
jgi:FkbM family methyltransferase